MMNKILFISPDFFEYYKDISQCLEEKFGYEVTWFSDRPTQKFIDRCLIRLNPKLLSKKNNKYFEKISDVCRKKSFDVIFVLFGQFLCKDYIEKLRDLQPNALFLYYTWDFSKNYKVINLISPLFDRRYSFDYNDYKENGYDFLPLFYNEKTINYQLEKTYDFSCVCTIKPGKYRYLKSILDHIPSNKNVYSYLYIQSKLIYLYYKFRYFKEFKGSKMSDFKYKKLARKENYDIVSKSKVVIDVPMKNQNGLTIRTLETLARKTKLLTTNSSIKHYDFYNESNIMIYNNETSIEELETFSSSEFEYVDEQLKKYELANFLKQLIGE